jgi:hypothetical protein
VELPGNVTNQSDSDLVRQVALGLASRPEGVTAAAAGELVLRLLTEMRQLRASLDQLDASSARAAKQMNRLTARIAWVSGAILVGTLALLVATILAH